MTGTAGDADTGKPEARFVYHLINIGSDFDQVVNSVNRDPPTSCESLMELNGHVAIGVPREQVWQALNDPEVLRLCIPGCESVERVSPDEMKARVQIKTGPVRAHFTGKILISEIRPDEGCVLHFEGSGGCRRVREGPLDGGPGDRRSRHRPQLHRCGNRRRKARAGRWPDDRCGGASDGRPVLCGVQPASGATLQRHRCIG